MRSWKIQAKNTFPFRPNAWIFQGEHLGYVSSISPSVSVYVLFLNLEIEILYLEFLQDMNRVSIDICLKHYVCSRTCSITYIINFVMAMRYDLTFNGVFAFRLKYIFSNFVAKRRFIAWFRFRSLYVKSILQIDLGWVWWWRMGWVGVVWDGCNRSSATQRSTLYIAGIQNITTTMLSDLIGCHWKATRKTSV